MAFIKFRPLASTFNFYAIVPNGDLEKDIYDYIGDEKIMYVFRAKRDLGIFTNKRILLIDKKGFRGFCKSIYSIEYKTISAYILNIHTLDATIDIIINSSHRININFLKPIQLVAVDNTYKYLTNCVNKD